MVRMMALILSLVVFNPCHAEDIEKLFADARVKYTPTKTSIADDFAFERMKSASDHSKAVNEQSGMVFFWVELDDSSLYKELASKYPNATHCFSQRSDFGDQAITSLIVRHEGNFTTFNEESRRGSLAADFNDCRNGNCVSSRSSPGTVYKISYSENPARCTSCPNQGYRR